MKPSVEEADPAALSIAAFCERFSVGRSLVYEEIKRGRLKAHKAGRRTLIRHVDAERWLANLPQVTPQRTD